MLEFMKEKLLIISVTSLISFAGWFGVKTWDIANMAYQGTSLHTEQLKQINDRIGKMEEKIDRMNENLTNKIQELTKSIERNKK